MFNVEHLSQTIKDKTEIIFQLWTYLYI